MSLCIRTGTTLLTPSLRRDGASLIIETGEWIESRRDRCRMQGQKASRSRDALFVRARVMTKLVQASSLQRRPSSDKSGGGNRLHHDRLWRIVAKSGNYTSNFRAGPGFRFTRTARKKKEAERRKVQISDPPQPSLRLASSGDARTFRRSTAALAKGTFVAQGSASGHASWDPAGALDPVRPPRPGAKTSRFSAGVTRAAPVPIQRSTSHAGHSAGRTMPKPPECK
jgi:hypothetical protein